MWVGQDRQRYHVRVRVWGKERRKKEEKDHILFLLSYWIGSEAMSLFCFPFFMINRFLSLYLPCACPVVCTVWVVYYSKAERRRMPQETGEPFFLLFFLYFTLLFLVPFFSPCTFLFESCTFGTLAPALQVMYCMQVPGTGTVSQLKILFGF